MRRLLPLVLLLSIASSAFANATITIVNNDVAGSGFNDPTPVAPVGGNTATTLGAQRLNVIRKAAEIWGDAIDSPFEITVLANFVPLTCTATAAVLGSAGPRFIFSDFGGTGLFPGAEFPGVWYPSDLTSKRAGVNALQFVPPPPPGNPPNTDIRARFNVNLGRPGCLTGAFFYLGLDDTEPGTMVNLLTVALHELAHGLGFLSFADVSSGAQILDMGDVYGHFLLDTTAGLTWNEMTNAQRAASAINSRRLVWNGDTVRSDAPSVLSYGRPFMRVNTPGAIAGVYDVGAAVFGPPLTPVDLTGDVVLALDPADGAGPSTTDACSPLTNAAAVSGRIALLDRGTCGFVIKVKNAQNAGARAVIVADNAAGSPPAALGGADPTITIPSVRITQADGALVKSQLGAGVNATLGVDMTVLSGADTSGRVFLNAPSPVVPGSSVSHWDPVAAPNLLMEPNINSDLTLSVQSPQDLTLSLLRDIGWFPDADNDGLADALDSCVASDLRETIFIGEDDTEVPNQIFSDGCTMSDQLNVDARNHGGSVSDATHLLNEWRSLGLIDDKERKKIHDEVVHK
jgi:hypothetical protein